MKTLRILGFYFIILTVALFAWSVWQVKHGSGHVDFSFVILAPVALGLVCRKQWAVWASVLLGIVSSSLFVGVAVAHSISHMTELKLGLGPFRMSDPSVASIWIFALIYVLIIGAPMMGAIIIRRDAHL